MPWVREAHGSGDPGSRLTWLTAEKNTRSRVGTASAHWTTRALLAMGCSSWWSGANLGDTRRGPLSAARTPTLPGARRHAVNT